MAKVTADTSEQRLFIMVNTFLRENDEASKSQFEQFAKSKLAVISGEFANQKESLQSFLGQLANAGFLGLNVPIEYGGKNSPFLHLVLLAETLANYDAGIVLSLAYHAATIELIKSYGSDEQKKAYLPKLAEGKLLGTLAYLELPKKITDASENVVISQNVLNGQKDFVIVSEQSPPNGSNKTDKTNLILVSVGKSFIVVDNLNTSTIKIEKQKMPMGLASVSFVSLNFDKFALNENSWLGSIPQTEKNEHNDSPASIAESIELDADEKLTFARNIIRTLLAAAALGMSDRALNAGIDCTKANQRNGIPLSQSEAIQWKLSDAATDISAARLLTYRAAWSKDEDKDNFSQYATMAKAYATRVARTHTGEGLQIILPFLQNLDSPLTCFYLDSKMLETFDATNEEEKILLSKLLGI